MNCGIITMHKVGNYGATYQALGLYKFLSDELNLDCQFIDYTMNRALSDTNKLEKPSLKKVIYKISNVRRYLDNKIRSKKFADFWNSNYKCTENCYNGDKELILKFPKFDCYISGSDQLFNLKLTNHSIGYFLPLDGIKKISYSTSFGMEGLLEKYRLEVAELLQKFTAISVREPAAALVLNKEINKDISVTADPVFLLNNDQWRKFEKKIKIPQKYILCYVMSNNSNLEAVIKWIERKEKLPVIIVKTYREPLKVKGKVMNNLGPDEFLYLLSHSSYVLTNSFHGCALSIIFGKNFFRLEEERFQDDKRYEALFSKAKIEGKIVPYNADWEHFNFESFMISGENVYDSILPWIDQSKRFLVDNLMY